MYNRVYNLEKKLTDEVASQKGFVHFKHNKKHPERYKYLQKLHTFHYKFVSKLNRTQTTYGL